MPDLRLCTFNVHGWRDASQRVRSDDAIELLRAVDCDVVFLNEVASAEHILQRVADALGCAVAFGPADHGFNAILSRLPLGDVEAVTLDAVAGRMRGALCARIRVGDQDLDLTCTHLDHRREDHRLLQLGQLLEHLAGRAPRHLLGGDLNAMRCADYAPHELAALAAARRDNGWEPAREDAVRALDAAGYVDLVRLAAAGSPARYRAELGAPIAAQHRVTSRVDSRIDYLFASPALAPDVTVLDARTIRTDVSDHHLVAVTLRV
ncbi:MAG: endonuclease/exonuclease/phosphatase family protein [Myxococcota bacterium]